MKPAERPSKESVRNYTQGRLKAKTPPPAPEEIRRQLGWQMESNNKSTDCAR